VFRGQYLPLSLSKRGVPYIKKTKRKKKASAKQKRAAQNKQTKNQKCGCPILPSLWTYPILPGLKTSLILLVRSCRSDLSDFTKPANLSDFTRAKNWSDLACPFVPLGLVRFYQGCELVHFYQRWKLVRSCLSVLPDFTKFANLSVFTRADNWSDLACPFCLILPRLITYQFLPGLRTCLVFPRAENLSNSSSCLSS
jgi:hypothetical protein